MQLIISAVFILLASVFPLSAYFFSISLFGLPHIAYELMYIRHNIIEKLPRQFLYTVLALLTGLGILKAINLFHALPFIMYFELIILATLFILAFYYKNNLISALAVLLFALGFIVNPIILLFFLAFIHNLTPWGFLAVQKATGRAWFIFTINPLIVFCLAWITPMDASFYSHESTTRYLSHYMAQAQLSPLTLAFFSTAVYLQLVHYYYVIRVLPGFCRISVKVHWIFLLLFLIMSIGFFTHFQTSKQVYAIIAMFHAYLELPLLLYLLPENTDLKALKRGNKPLQER